MAKTRTFILVAVLIMASLVSIGFLIPTDYKPQLTVNKRYELRGSLHSSLNKSLMPNPDVSRENPSTPTIEE